VIFDSANTTVNLVTGLDFRVSNRLRSRLSYKIEYNSNPPAGSVGTDTLTRATLIYGF
jgi:putative salt-induced outer membrane protein